MKGTQNEMPIHHEMQRPSEAHTETLRVPRKCVLRKVGPRHSEAKKSFIIRVEKPVLSRNKLNQWHWSKRHQESQEWEKQIWAEARSKGQLPKATGKMKVTITSFRQRLLDIDNLWGGVKGCVDALKRLGLVCDDSPDMIDLYVTQVKAKAGSDGKTEIEIGEVP